MIFFPKRGGRNILLYIYIYINVAKLAIIKKIVELTKRLII